MLYISITIKEMEIFVRNLAYETDFANIEQVERLSSLLSTLAFEKREAEKSAEVKA